MAAAGNPKAQKYLIKQMEKYQGLTEKLSQAKQRLSKLGEVRMDDYDRETRDRIDRQKAEFENLMK